MTIVLIVAAIGGSVPLISTVFVMMPSDVVMLAKSLAEQIDRQGRDVQGKTA